MKILLLGRYSNLGASSRYRSYQYLSYLRSLGHDIIVKPLLNDLYLERLYSGKRLPMLEVIASYFQRVVYLLQSQQYDVIWLEYEALPWLPYWFESILFKSNVPYIVDYDDAIFHRYDQHSSSVVRILLGKKIGHVMRRSALVIAGNDYIAGYAREAGAPNVEILPTVVDLKKYPLAPLPRNDIFTIGWIGTPRTSHYLLQIQDALKQFCENRGNRLVVIGASSLDLKDIQFEIKPWVEATEVSDMQKFDVGIMPLIDSPWERGKCGHKLIKYMACSLPVIASPVGVNRNIVEHGVNGFLASNIADWVKGLITLRENHSLRETMGKAGRRKVEEYYCTAVTAPKLASLITEIVEKNK
jgi:glycosyltransferase involved in cell wall biosynthesis